MRIGILGTGGVGRTLAGALNGGGHEVVMGSRDAAAALASSDVNEQTGTTLSGWHDGHAGVRIASFAEAAAHGEVVLSAPSGAGAMPALEAAGDANLDGKIVIDVSNPLEWTGAGPTLTVAITDSLSERLQRAHPSARIVKALNTVTASVMVDPGSLANGDHSLPICGDDDVAKHQVTAWLGEWFGWRDVVDLGDLSAARATEAYLLLWIRLSQATGSSLVSTRIVR